MVLAQKGDKRAYEQLLAEVIPAIRRVLRAKMAKFSSDHDDLVQEVVIAIHSSRQTYDSKKSFSTWMYAITRYKMIDFFRRKGLDSVSIESVSEAELQAEAMMEGDDLTDRVLSEVEKLPEVQREAIKLTKLEGLSIAEAALRLGVKEGALRVRIHRAYEKLRDSFERQSL